MARRDQTLYRDPDDKMVGGVASGIGHYFDIDTTLVRVAFVALAVLGGGGFLAYLILWVVLDPAPAGYWEIPVEDTTPQLAAAPPPDPATAPGFEATDARDAVDLTRPEHIDTPPA